MRSFFKSSLAIMGVLAMFAAAAVAAPAGSVSTGSASTDPADTPETSGSPYFFVKSDDPQTDALPLKSTDVEVSIAGVIADVTVTQVYANEGENPLEAIYVFPASTRAAVHAMKMTIGERTIRAEIQERKAARKAYEEAREAGQSASLLEQERPNVFQMNVANIMPGDVISVELKYTELLVPENKVYRFVYPTVVGPRYTGTQGEYQPEKEDWTQNPYLHEGEAPTSSLDIDVVLNAGMPVSEVNCSSHETDIRFEDREKAVVSLAPSEARGGNRDFILSYRLAGEAIHSGLMLYEDGAEKYFLLMMQSPERVRLQAVPPREYIFVVDVSGSMRGFPLDTSKRLLKNLVSRLRPSDRFNVLLFAGGSSVMAEQSVAANNENIQRALGFIEKQHGGGGTQLLPALQRALAKPGEKGLSRTLVVATDGYVNVEKEAFDMIRSRLGEANLFAFGIGSGVNRFLIEGMARAGAGEPFVVTNPAEASKTAERFRRMIQTPVLTDIEIDYGRFDAHSVEPPAVPDMFAEQPVVVFGKWQGPRRGKIRVSGRTGEERFEQQIDVQSVEPDPANAALRHLWARKRIALLADYNKLAYNDERKAEVTRLGLKYSLLTDYTSFVAIDIRVRNENGGKTETIRQPLPLPQGVSDSALGRGGMQMNRNLAARPLAPSAQGAVKQTAAESLDKGESFKTQIKIEIVEASGQAQRNPVEQVLHDLSPHVKNCFDRHGASFTGPLELTVGLSAKGGVLDIEWHGPPEKISAELKKCLRQVFEKRTFPAAADQKPYRLRLAIRGPHS